MKYVIAAVVALVVIAAPTAAQAKSTHPRGSHVVVTGGAFHPAPPAAPLPPSHWG